MIKIKYKKSLPFSRPIVFDEREKVPARVATAATAAANRSLLPGTDNGWYDVLSQGAYAGYSNRANGGAL